MFCGSANLSWEPLVLWLGQLLGLGHWAVVGRDAFILQVCLVSGCETRGKDIRPTCGHGSGISVVRLPPVIRVPLRLWAACALAFSVHTTRWPSISSQFAPLSTLSL
jgi:hypothetical protein